MIHQTTIKDMGKFELPNPQFGDFKLNVFPIMNTGKYVRLPVGYETWEVALNQILKQIPLVEGANLHYVTIDSKFFATPEFLRREGVHADGNFCVDPEFSFATWGGTEFEEEKRKTWGGTELEEERGRKKTWGGTEIERRRETWGGSSLLETAELKKQGISYVEKDGKVYKVIRNWVTEFDVEIPLGNYISHEKGGLFCVSSAVGCQAWSGEFFGEVGSGGCYDEMLSQLTDDRKTVFAANQLYFMTSNTPHESLLIDKGVRRTFMRVTLNHEYPNAILPCMQNAFAIK